jgi:Glucodextranase, domain B/Bacterial Ig-like domain (group 2)
MATGSATDTDGISVSTSVTLNIEKTFPSITITSPAEDSAQSSSSAIVSGTVTDSLTNVTGVACNGTAASFSGGGFSCNISLVPGVNLVVVNATDVAGNTAGARLHLVYSAALPAPLSLSVTPGNVTMLMGDTQQFTAVDEHGRPRSDATWTVSDTTTATISSDSFPILTGIAPGQVTLNAHVGSVSAQAQVSILAGSALPVGTVQWSAPTAIGFTTQQIVEASLSGGLNTPTMYSIEQDYSGNTEVRALTADGQQMWTTSLPTSEFGYLATVMPDASGGLLAEIGGSIIDIDGATGAIAFNTPNPSLYDNFFLDAVGPNGTAYATGKDPDTGQPALYKVDGNSGQTTIAFTAPLGVGFSSGDPDRCQVPIGFGVSGGGSLTTPVVGPDGSVYIGYSAAQSATTDYTLCLNEPTNKITMTSTESGVAIVSPSGGVSTQTIVSTLETCTDNTYPSAFYSCTGTAPGPEVTGVLPDGQGGVLAMSTDVTQNSTHMITDTTSGFTYTAPLGGSPYIVLGENSNAFVTDGISVQAFNPLTGSTQWTYQPSAGVGTINSIHGAGIMLFDGEYNLINLDSQGNPSVPLSLGSPEFVQVGLDGELHGVSSSGLVALISAPIVDWADGSWDGFLGGPLASGGSTALPKKAPLQSCPGQQAPCPNEAIYAALSSLISILSTDCSLCQTYVFNNMSLIQADFTSYLKTPKAQFYDGTRSQARRCGALYKCDLFSYLIDGWTVAYFFQISGPDLDAATTPQSSPLQIFFRPSAISLANGGANAFNMATIFHEGFHGKTGITDSNLQKAFGCTQQDDTNNITWYLAQFVSSNPPTQGGQVQACKNYPGHL